MERSSTFTGGGGFVIIPDEATREMAAKLANQFGSGCEHVVEPSGVHITLCHANLIGFPLIVAEKEVKELTHIAQLQGLMHMECIKEFAHVHLFWHVVYKKPLLAFEAAQRMAILALQHFLAPIEISEQTRRGHTERQLLYLKEYGYPLVLDEWIPHATLVSDSRGMGGVFTLDRCHPMTVERVAFARIGQFGKVDEILF